LHSALPVVENPSPGWRRDAAHSIPLREARSKPISNAGLGRRLHPLIHIQLF
jgi:hypothetical protein